MILLLNMVVAMMTDTYAEMSMYKKGIYNYQIMKILPQYKVNQNYGGLIAWTHPLNLISVPLIPYYLYKRNDKQTLRKLTRFIMMVNYSLHQVICSVLFVALNLLMLPFAYMKTILAKIRLAQAGAIRVSDVVLYVIIGIPLLLLL